MRIEGILLLACIWLSTLLPGRGMSPLTPFPYLCLGGDGSRCYAEIFPLLGTDTATIRCVTISWNDKGELLVSKKWETSGAYSYPRETFLTIDGRSMVQVVLPRLETLNKKIGKWDLLRFYRDGKLLKSVKVEEIVNVAELERNPFSPSEYQITKFGGGIEFFDGSSDFVSKLMLPTEKRISDEDGLLIIHTSQMKSLYYRLSDGKLIKSK